MDKRAGFRHRIPKGPADMVSSQPTTSQFELDEQRVHRGNAQKLSFKNIILQDL